LPRYGHGRRLSIRSQRAGADQRESRLPTVTGFQCLSPARRSPCAGLPAGVRLWDCFGRTTRQHRPVRGRAY
jgi:hypothetical protein